MHYVRKVSGEIKPELSQSRVPRSPAHDANDIDNDQLDAADEHNRAIKVEVMKVGFVCMQQW